MKHFLIEVFSDHQEQKWEKTSSVNKSVIRRVNTQWFGRKLVCVQPSNADQSGAFSLPYTVIGRRFGTVAEAVVSIAEAAVSLAEAVESLAEAVVSL